MIRCRGDSYIYIYIYEGTMRLTSHSPFDRNSSEMCKLLCQYSDFIVSIGCHTRLVFADEKPINEIDIFGKVSRELFLGNNPNHEI